MAGHLAKLKYPGLDDGETVWDQTNSKVMGGSAYTVLTPLGAGMHRLTASKHTGTESTRQPEILEAATLWTL